MNFTTMLSPIIYFPLIRTGFIVLTAVTGLALSPAIAETQSTNTQSAKSSGAGSNNTTAKSATSKPKSTSASAKQASAKPENKTAKNTENTQNTQDISAMQAAVLDPNRFFGQASFGYAAAQACPEVISKLFCYCGCDITDSHSSLLDCFTSNHGVDCHICQEEAVFALKSHREGLSTVEIQKRVDEGWSHHYPFERDSAAYTKYKANRLWTNQGALSPAAPASVPGLAPEQAGSTPPKTKSGKPFKPSCCAKDKHS